MTGLETWYGSVWDAVVTMTQSITEIASNTIKRSRDILTSFPGAAIHPGPIVPDPMTVQKSQYRLQFFIHIGVEEATPNDSLIKGVELGMEFAQKVSEDRCVGGTVRNAEIIKITPEWERKPQHLRCWTVVQLECYKVRI